MNLASPFSSILEPYGDELPSVFREQFLFPADANYQLALTGTMQHVWYRPRWLKPLFWLMSKFDLLVAENGENVPTTLIITANHDRDGLPRQMWNRTFQFDRPRYFNSSVVYDVRTQRPTEYVGPGRMLGMIWDIRFHAPATLDMQTYAWVLYLGRWRIQLPRWLGRWLFGWDDTIQSADDSRIDVIHIDLTISHPLFGKVFGYGGTFQVQRQFAS